MEKTKKWQTYKGRPFVKSGDTIYYGFPYEPFVTLIQIINTQKVDDVNIATKIVVHLLSTDKTKTPLEAIIKKGEKTSLADAFEMADIWLTTNIKPKKDETK